jgi:hypothetical protein
MLFIIFTVTGLSLNLLQVFRPDLAPEIRKNKLVMKKRIRISLQPA